MSRIAALPVEPSDTARPEPTQDLIGLLAAPGPMGPALSAALEDLPAASVPALIDRLVYHRVDGLAWRALSQVPADGVDPWLRATLKRRHQQRCSATLVQGLALAEVLETLAHASVPVVVTRGLRIVEWIYQDPGARPFEDHDLLVRPADEPAARAALARLGYEEAATGLFRRATVSIDLHTDPLGARRRPTRRALFPIDLVALFRDARPGWVAGGRALLLAPEDDLLLMALHVVKHSFDRLIRTADLAHLIAVHGRALCWEAVRDKAEAAHAGRLLGLALGAAEPLGVLVPEPVRLREPEGGLEGLLMQRVRALRPLPYGGEVLMALSAPRLLDRMRFLFDALFPAGERPLEGFRAQDIPRRTVVLLDGAARQLRARRRAR